MSAERHIRSCGKRCISGCFCRLLEVERSEGGKYRFSVSADYSCGFSRDCCDGDEQLHSTETHPRNAGSEQ